MIVVDSSVFIAILEQEPEAERFLSTIRDATRRLASAVTVYALAKVLNVPLLFKGADFSETDIQQYV
jgi:uncharacterized protein with PIN domain